MSGDLLTLGVVAAVAAAGLARRGSGAMPRGWTYKVTYDELDAEAEPIGGGFIVDGRIIELPDNLYGEAWYRWHRDHDTTMVLELADDDEVRELLGIDPDTVEIPDWVRAAITFAKAAERAGVNHDIREPGGWYTDHELSMDSGYERQIGYHLNDAKVRALEGLYDYTWPEIAYPLVNAMIQRLRAWNAHHREVAERVLRPVVDRLCAQLPVKR